MPPVTDAQLQAKQEFDFAWSLDNSSIPLRLTISLQGEVLSGHCPALSLPPAAQRLMGLPRRPDLADYVAGIITHLSYELPLMLGGYIECLPGREELLFAWRAARKAASIPRDYHRSTAFVSDWWQRYFALQEQKMEGQLTPEMTLGIDSIAYFFSCKSSSSEQERWVQAMAYTDPSFDVGRPLRALYPTFKNWSLEQAILATLRKHPCPANRDFCYALVDQHFAAGTLNGKIIETLTEYPGKASLQRLLAVEASPDNSHLASRKLLTIQYADEALGVARRLFAEKDPVYKTFGAEMLSDLGLVSEQMALEWIRMFYVPVNRKALRSAIEYVLCFDWSSWGDTWLLTQELIEVFLATEEKVLITGDWKKLTLLLVKIGAPVSPDYFHQRKVGLPDFKGQVLEKIERILLSDEPTKAEQLSGF
ncbi:MAG: hypothetical protein AAGJ82_02290 [Bacteroidota bacterium]